MAFGALSGRGTCRKCGEVFCKEKKCFEGDSRRCRACVSEDDKTAGEAALSLPAAPGVKVQQAVSVDVGPKTVKDQLMVMLHLGGGKARRFVIPQVPNTAVHHPLVTDLYLDPSLAPSGKHRMQDFVVNAPPRSASSSNEEYYESFQKTFTVLHRTAATLESLATGLGKQALDQKLSYANGLLRPTLDYVRKLQAADNAQGPARQAALLDAISVLHKELSNLSEGHGALVPYFWRGKEEGMAYVVIHKCTSTTFQVGVVNMQDAARKYHGLSVDGSTANAGEPQYRMPYVPPQVGSIDILKPSWLMFTFLLPLVDESYGKRGAAFLYECVVPAMTKVHPAHHYEGSCAWKQSLPIGGDHSHVLATLAAVRWASAMARREGAPMEVSLRAALLPTLLDTAETQSELYAVRQCLQATARERCAAATAGDTTAGEVDWQIRKVKEQLDTSEAKHPATASARAAALLPPAVELGDCDTELTVYPGCDLLDRQRYDLEKLAGAPHEPRVLLPIPTVHIADEVATPADCVHVLKDLLVAVNLYMAQHEQISNHAHLSLALFGQIFLRVVPLPKPAAEGKTCFWRPEELRYDTQQTLLRQLSQLSQCLAATSFNAAGREVEGVRVVVANCIMVLVDYLCRTRPTDCGVEKGSRVSVFTEHYSGVLKILDGVEGDVSPVSRYVPFTHSFVERTEDVMLQSPELAARRTEVLDYWCDTCKGVGEDRVLFKLENMKLEEADESFVTQLSIAMGNPTADAGPALTGESPWLLSTCPEVESLRDVAFLTQLMVSHDLHDRSVTYTAADAKLRWFSKSGDRNPKTGALLPGEADSISVSGFRKNSIKSQGRKTSSSLHGKLTNYISSIFSKDDKSSSTKREVSYSNPAVLAGDPKVRTEQDVLNIKNPPTFNGRVGKESSEKLLTFLAQPNLRIVLLLTWFDKDHIHCLAEDLMQKVVSSALFEPGEWGTKEQTALIPEKIPAPTRDHLRTPVGLLFEELTKGPEVTTKACLRMLECARERCTAERYKGTNADVLMYVARTVCRVLRYLEYLTVSVASGKGTRGLEASALGTDVELQVLRGCVGKMKAGLRGDLYVLLTGWVRRAEHDRTVDRACRLHAHLAMFYEGYTAEAFANEPEAAMCVTAAMLYISTYHSWGQADLGIAEVELCDIFEKMRRPIVAAMRDGADVREKSLESGKWAATSSRPLNEASHEYGHQRWCESLLTEGVFEDRRRVAAATEKAWVARREEESYADWVRRTTGTHECLQINMNNGTCSQNKDDLGRIPDEVYEDADYALKFGGRMRCSKMGRSAVRIKQRLVGTEDGEYDLNLWLEDKRPNLHIIALEEIGWAKGKPAWTEGPDWMRQLVRDAASVGGLMELMDMDLRIVSAGEGWQSLAGVATIEEGASHPVNVVAYEDPPVLHVFQLIWCGRRCFRRQVYTTDAVHSFYSPHEDGGTVASSRQNYFKCGREWTLCAGSVEDLYQPETSVQIFNISGHTRKMLLPSRLLRGVLPDALLEQYHFWQAAHVDAEHRPLGNDITGTPMSNQDATRLEVVVGKIKDKMTVTRVTQMEGDEETRWQLMNLLHPEGKCREVGQRLGRVFTRVENLSHILVWCEGEAVVKVELPRLRLSFTRSQEKLRCDQHSGYYLHEGKIDTHTAECLSQLGGGSILVAKATGELAAIASRIAEPLRPSAILSEDTPLSWVDRRFPHQLLFRRAELEVLKAAPQGARHHFYPIHHSHTALKTPTSVGTLNLMLCLALRRRYADVASMGARLAKVEGPEEQTMLLRIVRALAEDKDVPDAIACRLRLLWGMARVCNPVVFASAGWDEQTEVSNYVLRRRGVSCELLLTKDEELQSLKTRKEQQLCNRYSALEARERGMHAVSIASPDSCWEAPTKSYDCLTAAPVSALEQQLVYSKKPSSPDQGIESLTEMLSLMSKVESLAVYEVYTNTYTPMLLGNVDCHGAAVLGSLLARVVYFNSGSHAWLASLEKTISMQNVLGGKSALVEALPKLPMEEEVEKKVSGSGSWLQNKVTAEVARLKLRVERINEASKLQKEALAALGNVDGVYKARRVAEFGKCDKADTYRMPYKCPVDMNGIDRIPSWTVPPFVTDTDAPRTQVDFAPARAPLSHLKQQHVTEVTEGVNAEMDAFAQELEKRNIRNTEKVVRSIHERKVQERCVLRMKSLDHGDLQGLQQQLTKVQEEDKVYADKLCVEIMQRVNPEEEEVARIGGQKPTYDLPAVIRMYLSKADWPLQQQIKTALTTWLCVQSRRAQVQACLLELESLLNKEELSPVMGEGLARLLAAERHHVTDAEGSYCVDPRFLVFEFAASILMRNEQVKLQRCISEGKAPAVHQMIMGQGKTTVLVPLLTLTMGSGGKLVVVCMPKALVEFSRSVLLDCFSSPMLPKAVLSFDFQRTSVMDEALYTMLEEGAATGAAVVIHPATIKSLLLKVVLLFEKLDVEMRELKGHAAHKEGMSIFAKMTDKVHKAVVGKKEAGLSNQERLSIEKELKVVAKALHLMQTKGVVLMDEVDMLLHPLRSELNWPLGAKRPIDLTAVRIDDDKRYEGVRHRLPRFLMEIVFAHKSSNRHALSSYEHAQPLYDGLEAVIKSGYTTGKLQQMPHLVILDKKYYEEKMLAPLAALAALWLHTLYVANLTKETIEEYLLSGTGSFTCSSDADAKLLNLTHDWVKTYLPHCLMKVHRVSFGILREEELQASLEVDPCMARSRQLLAVPFVGKDMPSESSEFQHPDMAIGLTIHSAMQDGMRYRDLVQLLAALRTAYDEDEKQPEQTRASARMYAKWLHDANARVKGFSWKGEYLGRREDTAQEPDVTFDESPEEAMQRRAMWPLGLVDPNDAEQVETLGKYLLRSQLAAQHFLHECAFKEALTKAGHQLSASGQELASSLLSSHRVGFSGTPNDLLPDAMGKCNYAEGDDGEMVNMLTAGHVVTVQEVDRDPHGLLRKAAETNSNGEPKYAALIDSGALITGMSNREVGLKLFDYGLPQRGVVYLDRSGRRTVLLRGSSGRYRDVPLEQSGLPLEQRFTFYDHVHTTGMDIKQPTKCTACVTISQDMTFRDYAQGAYRMRGIGKGQTLDVFVPRDVRQMIEPVFEGNLRMDLLFWLLENGAHAESAQRSLLLKQRLSHVWRKDALSQLQLDVEANKRQKALQLLKEEVSHTLSRDTKENARKRKTLEAELRMLCELNDRSVLSDASSKYVSVLLEESKGLAVMDSLDKGQVSETEAEQAQEQQQYTVQQAEDEIDINVENEDEQEAVPETPDDLDWDKENPATVRWGVHELQRPLHLFNKFTGLSMGGKRLSYPAFLLHTENFTPCDKMLSAKPRRLKNVIAFLEVLPETQMTAMREGEVKEVQLKQLCEILRLYSATGDTLTESEVRQALKEMELQLDDDVLGQKEYPLSVHNFSSLLTPENMKVYDNRYIIAMSLEEVEHVRPLLSSPALAKVPMAIHVLHMKPSMGTTLLQTTKAYTEQGDLPANQMTAAEACLGFFNCDAKMPRAHMLWVLRLLQASTPEERRVYYQANRSKRRRPRVPVSQQPIGMVLSETSELELFQTRAVISKIKVVMVADSRISTASRLFDFLDEGSKGYLTKEDVLAGVDDLGLGRVQTKASWEASVARVFKRLGKRRGSTQDLVLSKAVVEDHFSMGEEEREELLKLCGGVRQVRHTVRPPRKAANPTELPPLPLPVSTCAGGFRVDAVHPASFERLWTSTDTACNSTVSVWRAGLELPLGRGRNAMLLRLGDYLRPSLRRPEAGEKCKDAATMKEVKLACKLWQVTDDGGSRVFGSTDLEGWVAEHFPHPVRYSLAYELAVAKPLYFWEPVPPDARFVGAGLVVTTSPQQPKNSVVRCVPAAWCKGDSSQAGNAGSIVWKERSQAKVQFAADPALGLFRVAQVVPKGTAALVSTIGSAPAAPATHSKRHIFPTTSRLFFEK